MKFAFIHAEKDHFPVGLLCRVLGVSRQGYYAYRQRPVSARHAQDIVLRERVREIHSDSRGTYGSPRVLHHSDRGCQYTSADYRQQLASLGIEVSMSRKGNCWDNAVAESFFATLKRELIYTRAWPDRATLRSHVFDYIEAFYNRKRLHSTLGYLSPAQVEAKFDNQQAA